MTALGWVLFGGMPVTPKSVLGLAGTFLGAFAYSYIGLAKHRRTYQDSLQSSKADLAGSGEPDAAAASPASVAVLVVEASPQLGDANDIKIPDYGGVGERASALSRWAAPMVEAANSAPEGLDTSPRPLLSSPRIGVNAS